MPKLPTPHSPSLPIFRWAGSKRKILKTLATYWDQPYRSYIEPFAGSAALFFGLQPSRAILNDTNVDLIQAYEQIRDTPELVSSKLARLPISSEVYYNLRGLDPAEIDPIERCARFIYLNRFCFNGIYRTNRQGQFNVPYAPTKTGKLPDRDALIAYSDLLNRVHFDTNDFESFIGEHVRQNDFVYLDPPYAVNNHRIFRQYGPTTFGLSDIDRLSDTLNTIDARGARFVVSYADSMEAMALTGDRWHVKSLETQRNVSGFSRHRRKAVELLISNFQPNQNEIRS